MKTATFILLLLALSMSAERYADLVVTDEGLCVAWNDHLRLWGTSTERVFAGPFCYPSLGTAVLNGNDVLIYTRSHIMESDSIFILDPATLETISVREILPVEMAPQLSWPEEGCMMVQTARYQPEENSFFICADPRIVCSGAMENNIVSARMQFDDIDGIEIADTLGTGNISYCSSYSGLTSPVFCGDALLPMVFWSYYGSYYSSSLSELSALHVIDGDPVQGNYEPILEGYVYGANGSFGPGGIKCSGASSDEVVVLWTIEDNLELWFNVYDCSGVTEILEAPMQGSPGPGFSMALSKDPCDEGMLLVYAEPDGIYCRYREDSQWNSWAYPVEEITGAPYPGATRVCSDTEGYWVSWWISGEDEPEIRFVQRGSVSSIGESEWAEPPSVELYPNPCSNSFQVNTECITGEWEVSVYDLGGRLIHTRSVSGGSSVSVDASGMTPGTYLIKVDFSGGTLTGRIAVFR